MGRGSSNGHRFKIYEKGWGSTECTLIFHLLFNTSVLLSGHLLISFFCFGGHEKEGGGGHPPPPHPMATSQEGTKYNIDNLSRMMWRRKTAGYFCFCFNFDEWNTLHVSVIQSSVNTRGSFVAPSYHSFYNEKSPRRLFFFSRRFTASFLTSLCDVSWRESMTPCMRFQ